MLLGGGGGGVPELLGGGGGGGGASSTARSAVERVRPRHREALAKGAAAGVWGRKNRSPRVLRASEMSKQAWSEAVNTNNLEERMLLDPLFVSKNFVF